MIEYSSTSHDKDVPDNFIYLTEVIPKVRFDLRYYSDDNFIGQPIPGYHSNVMIVTLQAAMALKKVQLELAYSNFSLKLFDAYRPQSAVDYFIRWANDPEDERMKAQYYPNVDKGELIPRGFIAEKSSHSRGSTVDLTIISNENGSELDMGTPFDLFDQKSWPSDTTVSVQQRANRQLLRSVMSKHGFIGLEEEWWHFTLRDEPYPDRYFDFPVK
ncbi:M15 family metallopeptidase [Gammaproteobacteria bacterium]|nr:M15 family metallopeptidase [Gammaproteobacteria bacterium]